MATQPTQPSIRDKVKLAMQFVLDSGGSTRKAIKKVGIAVPSFYYHAPFAAAELGGEAMKRWGGMRGGARTGPAPNNATAEWNDTASEEEDTRRVVDDRPTATAATRGVTWIPAGFILEAKKKLAEALSRRVDDRDLAGATGYTPAQIKSYLKSGKAPLTLKIACEGLLAKAYAGRPPDERPARRSSTAKAAAATKEIGGLPALIDPNATRTRLILVEVPDENVSTFRAMVSSLGFDHHVQKT